MTASVKHPTTGETLTYTGTREVTCATFAKGTRKAETVTKNGRRVKVWSVVDEGQDEGWVFIGWSTQAPLKAQGAARGTNPYFAHYMAAMIQG
jgi:hypothetical protein